MRKILFLVTVVTLLIQSNVFGQPTEFVEDFNNNQNNWFTGKSGTKEASIKNGIYYLDNFDTSSTNHFLRDFKLDPHQDYTIETKFKQTSGSEEYGFGILYGFDDWNNYIRIYVSKDYYKVLNKEREKSNKVVDWKKDDTGTIKGINEWNVLKVDKKGNEVKIYINNKMLKTIAASKLLYVGDRLGFFVPSSSKMEVDYIKVKHVKRKMKYIKNATLGELENLGPNVNSKYTEKSPVISADGKTMYFAFEDNPDKNIGKELKTDIGYSKLDENGNWSPMVVMDAPINNQYHNYIISMSPDENSALFGNVYLEDGSMTNGISYGIKRNGKWQKPKKVEITNYKNVNQYSGFWLAPDGLKLISACENEKSYGAKDLFVSFLQDDGSWSEPENMGANINTWAEEFTPYIAADGMTMFFSSYGHEGYGSADVFMTKRLDDTWTNWSDPVNCGKGINSEDWDAYFRIDAKGEYGYMVSTGDNSLGEEDIFRVKIGEEIRPELLNLITGKVYNAKTNEVIEGAIEYEDLTDGKKLGIAYATVENGYKIILPKGKNYGFRASADGFISVSNNIDLTNISEYGEKEVNLFLVPIEKGQSLTLNNLFFDSGKSVLKKESFSELNRLVKIMNSNPNLKIEIAGHTDSDGDTQKNLVLSQNRAKAVRDYLISKGVSSSSLTSVGYGESKPKAKNDTPEGKKMNRRVELKIL